MSVMRYFEKIAEGVDVLPLLHAATRQADLWNANTLRTDHVGSVHAEVDDIWLRFSDTAEYDKQGDPALIADEHESIHYPAFAVLPQARVIIFDLMRRVEGERLGRVMITRLKPGGRIAPHEDGGDHARYYDRYQVVLQGLPGSVFKSGDEQVQMKTGEAWWFDNSQTHEVLNNSTDDRVHLIVDIKIC